MVAGHAWGGAYRTGPNHPALTCASAALSYPKESFSCTHLAVHRSQVMSHLFRAQLRELWGSIANIASCPGYSVRLDLCSQSSASTGCSSTLWRAVSTRSASYGTGRDGKRCDSDGARRLFSSTSTSGQILFIRKSFVSNLPLFSTNRRRTVLREAKPKSPPAKSVKAR